MKFGSGPVGGVRSGSIESCMVFLFLVLSHFYCIGGGVECFLGHPPSEVGMVTPSEDCVNGMFSVGVGSTSIMPGMFVIVTCWCVRGAKRICIGAVGVDYVWVVYVGIDGTWYAVAPIFLLICVRLPHGILGMFDSLF